MPLVSIIIPTYNQARTLERALQSVTEQTLQDFEIIIVDDASTDSTTAVIDKFADPRIHYFRHDQNLFAGAARNTGMKAATGKYIAFRVSDDAGLPQKRARQVELLEGADQDCGCSYTGALINVEGGLHKYATYEPSWHGDALQDYLLGKFTIWTPTFLFRRELLQQIEPFDTSLIRLEDVDFYLRILKHCRLSCVSEPMVELFLDMSKEIAEVGDRCDWILLNKHHELIAQQGTFLSRYIYATYQFRIGERYLNEGHTLTGLKNIGKAILQNPCLPPKRYIAMLLRLFRGILKNPEPS
jgi:glycosyltransferase involved in cell wall biosynthesis